MHEKKLEGCGVQGRKQHKKSDQGDSGMSKLTNTEKGKEVQKVVKK